MFPVFVTMAAIAVLLLTARTLLRDRPIERFPRLSQRVEDPSKPTRWILVADT